jgi:hypothetical protein
MLDFFKEEPSILKVVYAITFVLFWYYSYCFFTDTPLIHKYIPVIMNCGILLLIFRKMNYNSKQRK